MTLIALEEHMLPADLARTAKAKHADVPRMREMLDEVGVQRLAAMDAAGIDIQVLSIGAPGAAALPPEESVSMARQLNDRVAASVAAHPDRFRAMATLPTPDPDAAVTEAYRAVRELGFCGVMINGHTNSEFLDEPQYDQILGAIAELGVPLYLHPTFPPQAVRDAYFHGFDPVTARTLYTGGWGWHAETGLHILRMAVGGVFDRYPDLQVVIGHMGENLPFSLMRADSRFALERPDLPSVAETILSHVHLTISGYTTVPPLQCALAVFGADRIMFAVDYPWSDSVETAEFFANAPLSPTDREKIAHLNAEQLYKL